MGLFLPLYPSWAAVRAALERCVCVVETYACAHAGDLTLECILSWLRRGCVVVVAHADGLSFSLFLFFSYNATRTRNGVSRMRCCG